MEILVHSNFEFEKSVKILFGAKNQITNAIQLRMNEIESVSL